jgi:hypothetical protein
VQKNVILNVTLLDVNRERYHLEKEEPIVDGQMISVKAQHATLELVLEVDC